MPAGINTVLMPRNVAGIPWPFIKHERAIYQQIVAQHRLNCIQESIMGYQTIGPIKE